MINIYEKQFLFVVLLSFTWVTLVINNSEMQIKNDVNEENNIKSEEVSYIVSNVSKLIKKNNWIYNNQEKMSDFELMQLVLQCTFKST